MLEIFISYAHEDVNIATPLFNLLTQTFGREVSVFLDKVNIRVGGHIPNEIKAELRKANLLLVLSTGTMQPSHSWTGFELGFFEACHPDGSSESVENKVITICRGLSTAPSPITNRRYVSLGIKDELMTVPVEALENRIAVADDDEMFLLLSDIHFTLKNERILMRRDLSDLYKAQVIIFKKNVYEEFKNRIKEIHKPQKQFLIRYSGNRAHRQLDEVLPDATVITSMENALEVFGVRLDDPALREVVASGIAILGDRAAGQVKARALDLKTLRKLTQNNPLSSHWINTLSKVVLSVNFDVDNSQVIASHDRDHRYRLVLTTSTTCFNGEIEASVYLVESLPQKDHGNEATSRLLRGLQIVCRFRFLFMEAESEFYWFNVERRNPADLPVLAQHLLGELDSIYTEARDAQLDIPGAWNRYVSIAELQAMGKIWRPNEAAIRALCNRAIEQSRNPQEAEKQADLKKIHTDLAAQLKILAEQIAPQNTTMLKAMAAKLTELA